MLNVTEDNFEKEVLKSSKPVVLDFWAAWCMPCQMMGPVFEEVSNELTDFKFVKVNVDENHVLSSKFMVSGIPTILVIRGGVEIGRFSGFRQKEELIADIKEIVMTNEMNG